MDITRVRAFRTVTTPVNEERGSSGGQPALRWSVLDGTSRTGTADPVAVALRRVSRAEGPPAVALVLGDVYRPDDNALLLEAVSRAVSHGRRLVLLHRGAGGMSLLRTAALESTGLRVAAVELPAEQAALGPVERLLHAVEAGDELRVTEGGAAERVGWRSALLPAPVLPPFPSASAPARPAGTVVVTGGLGGLGLRAAAVLSAVHGLRPVLLDTTAPQELTGRCAALLRRLRETAAGAETVTVDLTDARAAAAALCRIQGPVRAVVHCSGRVAGGPVSLARPRDLHELQAAKVAGLRNVLTTLDPWELRNVVVFGSITAHAPHRNMGGYALANELLRREALRWAARLPRCATVVAEWSLWSGAGQAHAMGAVAQARRMGMAPVALRYGMAALSRLFRWPAGPQHAAAIAITGQGDTTFPPDRPAGMGNPSWALPT